MCSEQPSMDSSKDEVVFLVYLARFHALIFYVITRPVSLVW